MIMLLVFVIILIFPIEIFLNCKSCTIRTENYTHSALNKNCSILLNEENELWHMKVDHVPNFLYALFI